MSTFDEIKEILKDTIKIQKNTQRIQEENSRDIKSLQISQAKTDEQLNKLISRTDHLDNFTNNYGQSLEEYFFHSLRKHKKLGNIEFDYVKKDIRGIVTTHQYDILMINGDCIGLIEVKNKVHVDDIVKLKDKIVNNFKKNFTQYKGFKHYFALASMVTYQDLIDACREEGIFLLTQKGNHIELVNDQAKPF